MGRFWEKRVWEKKGSWEETFISQILKIILWLVQFSSTWFCWGPSLLYVKITTLFLYEYYWFYYYSIGLKNSFSMALAPHFPNLPSLSSSWRKFKTHFKGIAIWTFGKFIRDSEFYKRFFIFYFWVTCDVGILPFCLEN